MNPNHPIPPNDDEINALLARQYRDTTPEFEARWVALKRQFRSAPDRRRTPWSTWLGLLATGSVAAVVLITAVVLRHGQPRPQPANIDPLVVGDLLAMDDVLGRGRVLLDAENRAAFLNLPVPPQSHN